MRKRGPSKLHIPTEEEFKKLLIACQLTQDPLLSEFIIMVMGVLGLRIGEMVHMKLHWIDFKHNQINVPEFEPCHCKYCEKAKKNIFKQRAKSIKNRIKNPRRIMMDGWTPKSKAGARSVPFGYNPEVKEIIQQVLTKHKEFPLTYDRCQKLFKYITRLAGQPDLFPHALRAYAATKYAEAGLSEYTLTEIMGWEDISIARSYVAQVKVLEEVKRVFGDGRRFLTDYNSSPVFHPTDLLSNLVSRRSNDDGEWIRGLLKMPLTPHQILEPKISGLNYKVYTLLIDTKMSQRQIAKNLNISESEVSRMIKILKKLQLVEPINQTKKTEQQYRGTSTSPMII